MAERWRQMTDAEKLVRFTHDLSQNLSRPRFLEKKRKQRHLTIIVGGAVFKFALKCDLYTKAISFSAPFFLGAVKCQLAILIHLMLNSVKILSFQISLDSCSDSLGLILAINKSVSVKIVFGNSSRQAFYIFGIFFLKRSPFGFCRLKGGDQ